MNEPIKKELSALWSGFKAWLALRDEQREADRKAAGIMTADEQRAERKEWEK